MEQVGEREGRAGWERGVLKGGGVRAESMRMGRDWSEGW